MSRRLDGTSRGILEFRPQIEFVEPDVEQGIIQPVTDPVNAKDIFDKNDQIRKLAKSVDTLAAALQNKADLRAKDVKIKLDPKVDAPIIQAMRRAHPGVDPTVITYSQYCACKDNQLQKGLALAKQGLVDPADIEKARQNMGTTTDFDSLFNSEAAKTGGFRPELNAQNQIIEPIDMEELQQTLLEMLVNFLWKSFIKPIIPLPFLPEEIAGSSDQDPSQFAKEVNKIAESGVSQADNYPNADKATQKAIADTGNMKAAGGPAQTSLKDAVQASNGDVLKTPKVNLDPFSLQDCFAITRAFERGAAYCTTPESVFALLRPQLNNIRIMAGSQESRSLLDEAIQDGALPIDTDADEETTGDDPAVKTDSAIGDIIEDSAATGAKKDESFSEAVGNWLKDCFPCDWRIMSAADFAVKLQFNLEEALMRYLYWFQTLLAQLEAIANLFKTDSKFAEICAFINFVKNFVCLPDLRKIIAILMLLLMRISFSINGLFDFILGLVAPLIIPFLSGIADTLEKFLLAAVKPIECIIDSIMNMFETVNYNAIFQKGNIRDLAVNVGPQGKTVQSNGVNFKLNTPRIYNPTLDLDIDVPDPSVQISEPKTRDGREWGMSFNFVEDATPFGDHIKDEEKAVKDAQAELEEIRARRSGIDFEDDTQRKEYLAELEAARKKRSDAVDERDSSGVQQLRGVLEGFKRDMRSIMITIARYLREAIDAVQALVAAVVGEFVALMKAFLGDGELSISLQFEKLEIIQIIQMMVSFIAWLVAGLNCDQPQEDEFDVSQFIPNNEEASIIQVADDGTVTITENPALIDEAIEKLAASSGPVPEGSETPGAEVVGTPADRSRQRLKSLVEFTGNPVIDTEIARVVDAITTPAVNTFKCPLQTSVAQGEQINAWMRELNAI